ncbi:MAG: ATP-binding protein [Verrucomicrobia bacterium]|nr:ATP-binding protein [Verrucomicrobiota bacterium]
MNTNLFQKAQRQRVKLKLAITGPAGSGKTTAALRLARGLTRNGRIAVIDTENRSASLYADLFEFDVLDLEPPFEDRKFSEGITAAVAAGYDAVILDSGSHFWEAVLDYKDKLDKRGGNSFSNWSEATRRFRGVLDAVLQSPIHVITCLRSKMDHVLEKDEKSGRQVVKKVGMAPIMRDGVEYEFTVVLDLDMGHQAVSSKDRTRLFDGRIFEITEATGQSLREWLDSGAATPPPQPFTAPEPAPAPPAGNGRAGAEDHALLADAQERAGRRAPGPRVRRGTRGAGLAGVDRTPGGQAHRRTAAADERPGGPQPGG